jgi:HEAT repeat protein
MKPDKSAKVIFIFLLLIMLSHNLFAEFELLKDKDPTVRSREALMLGDKNIKEAIPALIEALKDKMTGVRINAVVSLGKLGDERAIEPLIDILNNDRVVAARVMAAEALGNFDSENAKEAVLEASDSKDENVRYSAALSLGKIGGEREVDKLMEKASGDKHWSVRQVSLYALASIVEEHREGKGKRRAIEKVIKRAMRDENKDVRHSARALLKKLGKVPK